jgi:hypothetical protein
MDTDKPVARLSISCICTAYVGDGMIGKMDGRETDG